MVPVPAVISQNSKLEGHFNSWPHHRTTCRFFREAQSSDPAKKRQAKARKLVGREISREKARQRVTKADKQKQSKRECSHAGRQIRREKRQRPKEMDKPAKIYDYERSDTKETKVQERTHPPMLREKRTKTT